jgi:hypothetical protein
MYSFVILLATRRNQAIHDLVTRSTVQIRDPAKASPGQYVIERMAPATANMPSSWQRAIVILAYLLLTYAAGLFVIFISLSRGCIQSDAFCSAADKVVNTAISVGLLFLTALVIGLGWRGRLFGARKT